ncbi:MAG: PEP-CTERM sorting domain-containing protein [Alphaproteobacteria bacterium]|nr:PEP-CTERM sorting domain-containing protein [Alphaproteobacteria bacterium]
MLLSAAAIAGVLCAGDAKAALTLSSQTGVVDASPLVTFSEVPESTVNPAYAFAGAPFDGLTIAFAGYFAGQSLVAGSPISLSGSPTPGTLALVSDILSYAITANDAAFGSSPVITGGSDGASFASPVSILFGFAVPVVAFTIGEFVAAGLTTIEAFDATGTSLGVVLNDGAGLMALALSNPGGPDIAGLSISTSDLGGGFSIDDLFVARAIATPVPAPTSLLLLAAGLAGLHLGRRRSDVPVRA